MSALRDAIANPLEMSLAHTRTEPLQFVFADAPSPGGMDTESGGRGVWTYYPWGAEEAIRQDDDSYLIRYAFPISSDTEILFAHCLGESFESIYGFMAGRDFGDEVTPLIARRWPKTYELLLRGCGAPGWPALLRLTTSTRQWAVGIIVQITRDPTGGVRLPDEVAEMLMKSTMDSLGELLEIDGLLSELVYILGGDDHLKRTLKRAAHIIESIGDISDVVTAFR